MRYQPPLNEERKSAIIEFIRRGHTLSETMRNFNHTYGTIKKIFKDIGIVSPSGGTKFRWDDTFFDSIDTEDKAYWLGFISADGYIQHNKIGISLAVIDKNHLEKFVKSIGAQHPVRIYRKQNFKSTCRVEVFSKHAVNSLKKLGVGERKSHTLRPCKAIPRELMRHYWRGLLDGDGWITKNTGQRSLGLCGSLHTVVGFKLFVKRYVPTTQKVRRMRSIYAFSLSGKKLSQKLCRVLYGGSTVYLDRKKERADNLIKAKTRNARSWKHLKAEDLLSLKLEHGSWSAVGKFLGVGGNICNIRKKRGFVESAPATKPTHCPKGHVLSEDNITYKYNGKKKGGGKYRACKTCHREYHRLRYHRKKTLC